MPVARVPLVGTFNQRGLSGNSDLSISEDQRFLNCTFDVVKNPVTGKATVYLEKRPGWGVDSLVSSGIASTGLIKPQLLNAPLSAFGETNSIVYFGTTNIGNATGRILNFTETLISASSHIVMRSSDGTGWYYVDGAKDTLTYTGFTSSGQFTVSTIASTAGLYTGQLITGNTIGAAARVSSVNAATSTIGLTVANTANSTGALITKEPIAKIIDPNFVTTGTHISAFAPMDGYLFYSTDDGNIRNSDLNTDTVYSSNSNLAVQMSPDPPVAVATQKNTVIVLGLNSKEVFYNAGLATGSPLQRSPQFFEKIGCIDQRSVCRLENEIYFVATPYDGDMGVYRIQNLQAVRISTPAVDRILGTIASSGAIYANAFRLGGYSYAGFVVAQASDGPSSKLLLESGDVLLLEATPGGNTLLENTPAQIASFIRYLVYNIGLNLWSEWDCNQATFVDSVGSGTGNQIIATSRMNTSGKIYKIDPVSQGNIYTDDGATYSTEARTSKIDLGTNNRKYITEIDLIADTQSTGTCDLYYSDDDYKTWKGPHTFDLTKKLKQINRLGAHYDGRAYRVVHYGTGPFRAEAIEIKYRVGLS